MKESEVRDLMELSGPAVWPSLTAYECVDRYIFRRPEIAYLRAIRKTDAPKIRCRIRVMTKSLGKRGMLREKVGEVIHERISGERGDVTSFLRSLRFEMKRSLPEIPIPGMAIALEFDALKEGGDKNAIAYFTAPWL
jgi:hypothetical protein